MNIFRCCARPSAETARISTQSRITVDKERGRLSALSPLMKAQVGASTQVRISHGQWTIQRTQSGDDKAATSEQVREANIALIERELFARTCYLPPVSLLNAFSSDGKSRSQAQYLTVGQLRSQRDAFALLDTVIEHNADIDPNRALDLVYQAYRLRGRNWDDDGRSKVVLAAATLLRGNHLEPKDALDRILKPATNEDFARPTTGSGASQTAVPAPA